MKISKKAQHAATILGMLRFHEKRNGVDVPMKGHDITAELKFSAPDLEQIAGKLLSSGVIQTIRGCKGGYMIRKNPVSYWEIIQAFNAKDWNDVEPAFDYIATELKIIAENYYI